MDVIDVLDEKTIKHLRHVYPDLGSKWLRVASKIFEEFGKKIRITSAFRSIEEQKKLYDRGRLTPGGIVTMARPGRSLHNYGLAIDSCFVGEDPYLEHGDSYLWNEYGKATEAQNLTWGGRFKKIYDKPHIECAYGFNVKELMGFFRLDGLLLVWSKIDESMGFDTATNWTKNDQGELISKVV